MCGRFTLTIDPGELQDAFPEFNIPQNKLTQRFNIAPSQPVAVIPNITPFHLEFFTWGLIPSWSKDTNIGAKLINARSETLAEKPSFRNAFKRRRCLILADGFYEWKQEENLGKVPQYIHIARHKPFAFAGLWEVWISPNGDEIKTCTIITTQANQFMIQIHGRMPVILSPEMYKTWLQPDHIEPEALNQLLVPYSKNDLLAYPVSKIVNSPQNDTPACITPLSTR
jgi:putative SOS response-associated peptidase YedK